MTPAIPKRAHPATLRAAHSQRQRASVGLAIALATTGVLPVFLTGALAVQVEADLHVGTTAIGGAVATFFAASALSSVRAGRLAERVGPFKVMLVAVGFTVATLAATGLVVTSLAALLGILVAGGLSNGAIQPAVNLLLSKAVDDRRQGLAFGVKQAAIPTSTLLSGLAVPALALTAGWHAAYLAAAGLALLVWAVLLSGGRPLMPRPAAAGGPAPGAEDAGEQDAGGGTARLGGGEGAGFDPRPLVFLAAATACAVAASNAMGSFVIPGVVHAGVSPGVAGLLSAAGSIVALSARVGFGWRADRGGLRGHRAADAHLKTIATLVAVGALGYGVLAVGTLGLLVPAILLVYGGGWGYNGLFNAAVVRAYPETPARATGVTQVGTYVGGMIGPLGFGILVDHLGFGVGWALCAGLDVVAVAAFALSRRRLRAVAGPAVGASSAVIEGGEHAPEAPFARGADPDGYVVDI